MKFYKPDHGQRMKRTWFALFPVTVNGETRWLEKVTVEYYYDGVIKNEWRPQYFIDT